MLTRRVRSAFAGTGLRGTQLAGTKLELSSGGGAGAVVRAGTVVQEQPVVRLTPDCGSRFPSMAHRACS